jgi:hypothetical protein
VNFCRATNNFLIYNRVYIALNPKVAIQREKAIYQLFENKKFKRLGKINISG